MLYNSGRVAEQVGKFLPFPGVECFLNRAFQTDQNLSGRALFLKPLAARKVLTLVGGP